MSCDDAIKLCACNGGARVVHGLRPPKFSLIFQGGSLVRSFHKLQKPPAAQSVRAGPRDAIDTPVISQSLVSPVGAVVTLSSSRHSSILWTRL